MGRAANRNDDLEHALRSSAATDLLHGLGLDWAAPALTGLARLVVRRFVGDLLQMDAAIARGGLSAGADVVLARYAGTVTIRGAERVPASGPLVVAANHAGVVDAPAIWRLLAVRDDLLIIALDRPILRAVPNLASRLLTVNSEAHGRSRLVRRVADHLRSGGAVLTFPAGTIEPDPALRPEDALSALASWGAGSNCFRDWSRERQYSRSPCRGSSRSACCVIRSPAGVPRPKTANWPPPPSRHSSVTGQSIR